MHPALRTFRDEVCDTFVRTLAYVGGLAVLAIIAAKIFGIPVRTVAIERMPGPDWINIVRPFHAFALTIPEFAEPEPDYAVLRHAVGGGRRDIMTWGGQDGRGSRLMVEIYRAGKELGRFGAPSSEVAARTGVLGTAAAVTAAETIDSKFGLIALVDFTVRTGDRSRRCLGFTRAFHEPLVQIAGWYCNAGDEVVERGMLFCALDRLTLLAAHSEPKVQALFAHAELKRKFCGQKGPSHVATHRRNDWISASKTPKLRGRVAGR